MKYVASGAFAVALTLGAAGTANAGEHNTGQHAGGNPPPTLTEDAGARVLGETLRQPQAQAQAQSFAVTGSDLLGLAALGLGAVAVGSTVVVGSRRRAVRATA